jgi:hypothetical protein
MSNDVHPPDFLGDDGVGLRVGLPVAEQLLDSCADALWYLSNALDTLKSDDLNERFVGFRPRMQQVYDQVNSIMKELAD